MPTNLHHLAAAGPTAAAPAATSARRLNSIVTRAGIGCLCVVLLAAAASAAQRPGESDQQTIISLERAWNEAFYRRDTSTIEALLADDFTVTYDDGSRGDKARELTLTREFNQQVESSVQENFIVRIYGNTAVVSFTLRVTGIKLGSAARWP